MARTVQHRRVRVAAFTIEIVTMLLSLAYLLTTQTALLIAWEMCALVYLFAGLCVSWEGKPLPVIPDHEARETYRWSWVSSILSALIGVYSAMVALRVQSQHEENATLLIMLGGAGIALAWAMLHAGFAAIYQTLDCSIEDEGIEFPDRTQSMLNYVYFSFTVAVSFATSDPVINSVKVRRVVLIHSVFSFFYNAVVVAVAFQILQGFIR